MGILGKLLVCVCVQFPYVKMGRVIAFFFLFLEDTMNESLYDTSVWLIVSST